MNEAEWFSSTDPMLMLEFLKGKASDRKLRLFACHCFHRLLPHGISDEAFFAVGFAELFADRDATAEDLSSARTIGLDATDTYGFTASAVFEALYCVTAFSTAEVLGCSGHVIEALGYMGYEPAELQAELEGQCRILRDLFGPLPFRTVAVDQSCLPWNEDTIPKLAQAIYDERAFDRLPILADTLEEAGCTDADILAHFRQPGEHVRGCWALDLVLGKH